MLRPLFTSILSQTMKGNTTFSAFECFQTALRQVVVMSHSVEQEVVLLDPTL